MKSRRIALFVLPLFVAAFAWAAEDEDGPIAKVMQYAHKAPKGTPKVIEKIEDGSATEAEFKKTLELYQGIVDVKPPQGDPAKFKAKVQDVVAALQEVEAKKPDAGAHLKHAVDCKACHTEFKPK